MELAMKKLEQYSIIYENLVSSLKNFMPFAVTGYDSKNMNKVSSLCGEVKIISRVYSCSSAVHSIVYPFNADEAPFFRTMT